MSPKLYDQACYALYSASNQVTKAYRSLLQPFKLTYPQFVAMMALWEEDNVSVSALAKTVGVSKATMTPLLKRLELLGYIRKEQADGDDRQKCIVLTNSGQSLAQDANEVAKKALCATGLENSEVEQLIQLCGKIKHSISNQIC